MEPGGVRFYGNSTALAAGLPPFRLAALPLMAALLASLGAMLASMAALLRFMGAALHLMAAALRFMWGINGRAARISGCGAQWLER